MVHPGATFQALAARPVRASAWIALRRPLIVAFVMLDALRNGRTVVYDRDRVYGDPAMMQLASDAGGLPRAVPELPAPGAAQLYSRIAVLVALAALVLFNRM
jgi:hypothetical protein